MNKHSSNNIILNNNLSQRKWLVLLILPILNWGCYWYVGIPHTLEKALALASSVILIVFFILKIIRRTEPRRSYGRIIEIIVLLSFVSIINAYLYWGQQPWWTFSAGYGIYIFIYLFVLKEYKASQKQLVVIQSILAIIYIILWFYALSQAPNVIFGNADDIEDDRGFFRILLLGVDFVCLMYYYSIVKFFNDSRRIKWLLLSALFFLMLFASLSRMLIASTIICTCLYVMHRKSFKLIVVVLLFFTFSYGTIMRIEVVNNMFELTEMQAEKGQDGIVRSEWGDSFKLIPFHFGTFLFGNGQDHVATSYGKFSERMKEYYSFHRTDAGYPGFYVTYGWVPFLLLIYVFVRALRQKVPEDYYYYKLYISHFVIVSLTTYYFVSWGASLMMAIYVLDQLRFEVKNS